LFSLNAHPDTLRLTHAGHFPHGNGMYPVSTPFTISIFL